MKYLCDPQVIPTVVPRDLSQITLGGIESAQYSTWMHVDIDDGKFEQAVSWPYTAMSDAEELEAFKQLSRLPEGLSLEAHLMVSEPLQDGVRFAKAGFKRILTHIEAFADAAAVRDALKAFRAAGASEVGLVLKLDTPLSSVDELVAECDVVQLMSIAVIGSQGQAFEDRVLARVEELHANYPDLMVAVDGGVSEATVEELVRAGANRLVVGHALSSSANPAATYAKIVERAMRGCAPVMLQSAI